MKEMTDPSTGRLREAHGGGPESEPDNACEFGDLLIGVPFWFKGDQYIKVSVTLGRLLGIRTTTPYIRFKGDEQVEIT